MNTPCAIFRAELEQALAGPGGRLEALAAQTHPLGCASCRAELERERALEACLERDPAPERPAGLAARTLARLAEERRSAREQERLDRLLEVDPLPSAPVGLAQRVLHRLAPARARSRRRSGWLVAAAAILVLGVWGWRTLGSGAATPGEPRVTETRPGELPGTQPDAQPEDEAELLAYALDNWELLQDEDLDLWLASLDPLDQAVLEYADSDLWSEPNAFEPAPAERGVR